MKDDLEAVQANEIAGSLGVALLDVVKSGKLVYNRLWPGMWRMRQRHRKPRGQEDFNLESAAVYVVTRDAVRVCVEAATHMKPGQLPFAVPPALPMWVEFDRGVLEQEGSAGVLAFWIVRGEHGQIEVHLLHHDGSGMSALLFKPGTSEWIYDIVAPCNDCFDRILDGSVHDNGGSHPGVDTPVCVFSLMCHGMTPEEGGFPLGASIHTRPLADQWAQGRVPSHECRHSAYGQDWANFLNAFLYLLSAEGVRQEVIIRDRRRNKGKKVNGRRPPAVKQRIVRISLTHKVHRVYRHGGEIRLEAMGPDEETRNDPLMVRVRDIAPHPPLLIAGPGTRWTQTRVITVDGFSRRYHVKGTIRYLVEE